jgi:dUTP pyrophosphatase
MTIEPITVLIQREANTEDLPLPRYATPGSAGLDLLAAVDSDIVLLPGQRESISTGIRTAIPDGFEGQVRPRSGLALRNGISMVNTPGTIDSDYRGTIRVILINLGNEPYTVKRGERIAQLVITPIARALLVESKELPETIRNDGGFGHTGK